MRRFRRLILVFTMFVCVHSASGEAAEITKAQCDSLRTANKQQMNVIVAFADVLKGKYKEILGNLADNMRKTDISEINKSTDERTKYLEDFNKAIQLGDPATMRKAALIIDIVCEQ